MPVTLPEVYSAAEIALAAGVHASDVLRCAQAQHVQPLVGGFYSTPQAVRMVRQLVAATPVDVAPRELFDREGGLRRRRALPIAVTTVLHMGLVAGLALVSTAARRSGPDAPISTQLVFVASPAPGGGGGGGGRRRPKPIARSDQESVGPLRSPTPDAQPDESTPAREARDERPQQVETPEPPTAGDADSGTNAGVGPDSGSGIGTAGVGGTGGGPYRPGSGISPPSLLLEVRPDYTDEGRRRGLEGNVDLEIVVRSDGTVGGVTLRRGLGAGLDERAIDAVRRWRFAPATLQGTPVDVVVRVAVEFRLR